ncbi:hypothetical protein [Pseudarthrobacter sp. SSS035]|uniref:hypothetical protein n=1 Tax=Pseudarthrobacter sp. SSS035 TaxID=2931399 RepID=UPI00200C5426|nr:hypothetical protein [Pseudarthrobacter sp. SSS035]
MVVESDGNWPSGSIADDFEMADIVMSSVRQGMETAVSTHAIVRHHVENLLSAFALAISTRDEDLLGELIRGVQIRFGRDIHSSTDPGPEGIIDRFEDRRRSTVQTVSNIGVKLSGRCAHYVATFQDWDLESEPTCTSIGSYEGCLIAGPQVWRWTEHAITWKGRRVGSRYG